MTDEELDTLAATFFCMTPDDDFDLDIDIEILTDEDRVALGALGDDLIDRLLKDYRNAH